MSDETKEAEKKRMREILNRSVTIQMRRKRATKNLFVMQISIAAEP